MENLSFELKRMNRTLLFLMVIVLFGSCGRMGEMEILNEPIEVITEGETDEIVDLGDGFFGIYTGDELRIYHYNTEQNELTLKKTEYLYEYDEE